MFPAFENVAFFSAELIQSAPPWGLRYWSSVRWLTVHYVLLFSDYVLVAAPMTLITRPVLLVLSCGSEDFGKVLWQLRVYVLV